ncbi:hypothetical protein [Lysobacter capsici]|uniref:hypothetical protein n=1 Tax=Lysobacter capsici TaxID=435897 RepID=UPI001C00591E|nr:hypothetical protein [Lysobacter capsici]QWF16510.1 hypothetical protein KME82_22615 [Lysobacter capsici]
MSTTVCAACKAGIDAGTRRCPNCGEPALAQLQFGARRDGDGRGSRDDGSWLPMAGIAGVLLVALGVGAYLWYSSKHDAEPVVRVSTNGTGAPVVGQARSQDELQRGIQQIFIDVLQKGDREQSALESRIDALKLEQVLSSSKLASAKGIRESREALRQYGELVEQARSAAEATRTEINRRVRVLCGDSALASGFLRDYENMRGRLDVNERNAYDNYRSTMRTVNAILDFAQSRSGRMVYRDDTLLFNNAADFQAFERLARQLRLNDAVARDNQRALSTLRAEASRQFVDTRWVR